MSAVLNITMWRSCQSGEHHLHDLLELVSRKERAIFTETELIMFRLWQLSFEDCRFCYLYSQDRSAFFRQPGRYSTTVTGGLC